ncbi:MAG: hypothetical protein AAGE96_04080 [Cyanobacteria bacterium P01_G01_bin.19]
MLNFQDDLHSLPFMLIASFTMIMATLMFLSYLLAAVPTAI